MFSAIIFCSASSGWSVVSPWKRSGRQGEEALAGEAVADVADVVVEAPPLLQDDERRASSPSGSAR